MASFFFLMIRRPPRSTPLYSSAASVCIRDSGWATGPLLTDAKGKAITDPRKASRDYPGLNYEKYCSSFCVKDTGIKVGQTHPKVR